MRLIPSEALARRPSARFPVGFSDAQAWVCRLVLAAALATALATVASAGPTTELQRAREAAEAGRPGEAASLTRAVLPEIEAAHGINHPETILALLQLTRFSVSAGRAEEALAHADEALRRTELGGGRETAFHGLLLLERGKIAGLLGRMAGAERDLEAALGTLERELGDADVRTGDALRSLAIVRAERGKLADARALFERAVDVQRRLPERDKRALANALLDLGGAEARLDRVEGALERISEAERLLGRTDGPLAATAKIARAEIALRGSQLERAEELLREAVALADAPSGEIEQVRAKAHYALGLTYLAGGRGRKGEQAFREALRLFRQALGEEHPAVGRALLGLGLLYSEQGQPSLALDLIERAIAIFSDAGGAGGVPQAEARVEYAFVLRQFGESAAALSELEKAAADLQAAGRFAKLRLAFADSARGFILADLGRVKEATESLERAIAGIRAERGDDSSHLLPGLIKLTELYARAGRVAAAEASIAKSHALIERDRAFTPRLYGAALAAEARLHMQAGRASRAADTGGQFVAFMRERLQRAGGTCSANLGEQRAARQSFETVLEVYHEAAAGEPRDSLSAMFETAQFPHLGETARTSVLTARRHQTGAESELLRKLQDLREEECALETAMLGALGGLGPEAQQNPEAIAARLEAVEAEIAVIDAELDGLGSERRSMLDPRPVDVTSVARLLAEDEALLLQLTGEDATHLFFVHGGRVEHARTALDAAGLARHAELLRAATMLAPGMDFADLPDFPAGSAHDLYRGIFAPFEEHFAKLDHVFFVPDREMRALPPSVLLRSLPESAPDNLDFEALASLDYLARSLAVTILPAPDTLVSQRQEATPPRGDKPFVGVGDPVLGPLLPELPEDDAAAEDQTRALRLVRADGTANPRAFRLMTPLPETREELLALATALGADPQDAVVVGDGANEAWVREAGALADARVVAFATHGLVSGEFGDLSEPALVLTPPDEPSARNDGLLTASEIARLELNAEWVLLSACNTAAGRNPRAEGLSGLARAFMHAGARSLMVSHWYVPSDAATALTVFAGRALSTDPDRNRARALQTAMLKVLDGEHPDGRPRIVHAHPLFWAPFVTVGEGRQIRDS